jgi:Ni/Co efflux regulator RcnB
MTRHALVAVSALVSGLMLATPGLAAAQDRDRQSRDNKRRNCRGARLEDWSRNAKSPANAGLPESG